mmetsp:Transcript_86057/g.168313  ORF Transcript_86057/g.168313 Transcript_86057/m.168313 type:complete len:171 (-) Transcript_86057:47-559(-)
MVGLPMAGEEAAGDERAMGGGIGDSMTTMTFVLESARRLLARERQILFHHRSALCFYPAGDASSGWLVGFAAVQMDGLDMQAFIGFVCFFGVALPLICLVTALLHYSKYERCKQHLQQLRLEFQREQLEREMASRRGFGGRSSSSRGLPMVQPSQRQQLLAGAFSLDGGP